MPLKLTGGQGEYRVLVDFENRWRQPLKHEELTYKGGQEVVNIPVPANLGAGINLVNVIVRNPAGASVAWAQTYLKAAAPLTLKSVTPEKDIIFGQRAPRQG